MGLSAAELAYIRSSVGDLMPDTCNILSVTRAWNGTEHVETWGTATASVACRLDNLAGVEQVAGGAMRAFTGWLLTLPYDTTITAANRIEHGGNTYDVTSIDDDKSWIASVRCRVELVNA